MPARVLVVDDEPGVRDAFVRDLQALGCVYATAESAEEALALARQSEYDIVFSDLMLPGMNGLELLRELARRHPRLLVVIMTAYPSEELSARARAFGAFLVLAKPCGLRRIEAAVATARERRGS
jgi:DNA-binding NtrC family response regulator